MSDDIKWQDLASCNGIESYIKVVDGEPIEVPGTNLFFDEYESDDVTARNTDQMCFHCPVAKQCLEDGMTMGSWGVHGGIYLVYGRIDHVRNLHKTEDDWKELEKIHGRALDASGFERVSLDS